MHCSGYAPEQNGIAERMNRTLVEAARSMIVDSGLSKSFWAEAIDTANYVFNRISGNKKNSPFEVMFHIKPKITHFQEFGCDADTMIPHEKRRKLDDKASKMKFVGYDESSKGYRLVDSNNKICVSREVHFLRNKSSLKRSKAEQEVNENEFDVYFRYPNENDGDEYFINEESDQEEENLIEQENLITNELTKGSPREAELDEKEEDPVEEENLIIDEPTRRSPRDNIGVPPEKYKSNNFLSYQVQHKKETTNMDEPKTFIQATHSNDADEWLKAMKEEFNSIQENVTWELTELPNDRKSVGSKWVFKRKTNEKGETVRYKARLVAQGFSQKFGIDYDEVFAPVARSTTIFF